MKVRVPALSLLVAAVIIPALSFEASAQEAKSFSIGSFQSPKGIGLCWELQQDLEFFDSFDIIADMFGILNGDYSRPGYKATYCRNIILKHFHHDEYKLDLYAGPGITAGYVRDIHEPMSIVAGLAGSGGCRLFFDNKRLIVYLEVGVDLAAEINRNNRYKTIDLDIYKSGIVHAFYPQVRILYKL